MKKTLIASAILLASSAANAAWTSPDGSLTIGGNVEINTDYVDTKSQGREGATAVSQEDSFISDDSRFLLDIQWANKLDNGQYIRAAAQPLLKTNGSVELDDSYVAMGVENDWEVQLGRFEAMELFSTGKDTVAYIAEGGDAIGGGVYYYKGHEARGRRGNMGQARVGGQSGNWTYEVSSAFGDTSEILTGGEDNLKLLGIDEKLESDNNSFVVRPAANYTSDNGFFSLSFGAEYDVSSNEATVTTTNNSASLAYLKGKDLTDRTGFSVRSEFAFSEDMKVRLSGAYQDLQDVWTATHFNVNFEYKRFGMGVSVAENNLDSKVLEDVSSYVAYAAYTMPIMDFENAEITFAASYSETENAFGKAFKDDETAAVRARINYYFE